MKLYQIKLYKNSFKGHRCPISHIDALSMPFSMGAEKSHRYRCQTTIVDAQWRPCQWSAFGDICQLSANFYWIWLDVARKCLSFAKFEPFLLD